MGKYRLHFYKDEHGDDPVRRWFKEELTRLQRLVVGTAMREVLEENGIDVCETEFGTPLGGGLFEFRVRGNVDEFVEGAAAAQAGASGEKILIRVFCHAHGDQLILLLGGYDKLAQPSKSHQNEQIQLARKRLTAWKLAQAKAKARSRRRTP
jgi:hypothetical protein